MLVAGGCGLPDYSELPKPVALAQPDATSFAFRTPSDVSNVTGYALFYKLYSDETDFDSEDDSYWLSESSYIGTNEMETGYTIPRQRGFIRIGIYGSSTIQTTQLIDFDIADRYVYIDFDNGGTNNGAMDDGSLLPVVMYDSYPAGTPGVTLSRGINDPTDAGNSDLRSFVSDWDYDDGLPADGYNDADLYRKNYVTSSSNVNDIITSLKSGTLIDPIPSELIIGLAVCSYGYDPSPPTPLYSKPVFLGKVKYQSVNDANRGFVR